MPSTSVLDEGFFGEKSKRGDMQMRRIAVTGTADTILTVIPVTTTVATYLGLAFWQALTGIEIDLLEKLTGAGLAGLVMFLVIKYLLNKTNKLESKIEQMHEERMQKAEKDKAELIEMLKQKK